MAKNRGMGGGLHIGVRVTDGISFSRSSHCPSNKGLIEGAGAPTRKRRWVRETDGESWSESALGEGSGRGTERGQAVRSEALLTAGHRPTCHLHILSSEFKPSSLLT